MQVSPKLGVCSERLSPVKITFVLFCFFFVYQKKKTDKRSQVFAPDCVDGVPIKSTHQCHGKHALSQVLKKKRQYYLKDVDVKCNVGFFFYFNYYFFVCFEVFCLFVVLGFLVCLPRRSLCVNRNIDSFHTDILKYLCLNYSHVPSFVTSESLVRILEGDVEGGGVFWGEGSPLHTTSTLAYTVCVLYLIFFFLLFSLETAKDQAMMMAKYLSISNQYLLICNLLLHRAFVSKSCFICQLCRIFH